MVIGDHCLAVDGNPWHQKAMTRSKIKDRREPKDLAAIFQRVSPLLLTKGQYTAGVVCLVHYQRFHVLSIEEMSSFCRYSSLNDDPGPEPLAKMDEAVVATPSLCRLHILEKLQSVVSK